MTNIAELGISVDSSGVAFAATDLDKLADAGAAAEKTVVNLSSTAEKGGAALKEVGAGAKTVETEMAKLSAQTEKYTVSVKQQAAALRGVPAQFTDIVTGLQGGQAPLTVLLQQGGQLKDMFGGVGPAAKALGGYVAGLVNPFTVAAAAAAALGLAYSQGSKEATEYNRALILSGNAAGTSANQLADMARQVSITVGTTGAAAEVLAKLAGNGQIASASFEEITKTALLMEKATGQSVDETVAAFAALGKEPVAASMKLNEQYHYLTASVYEQIAALEKNGDHQGAVTLATNTYIDTMRDRSNEVLNNLSLWERGYNSFAEAAGKAYNAVKNVGRENTPQQNLADAYDRLNQLTQGGRDAAKEDPFRYEDVMKDITKFQAQIANDATNSLMKGFDAQDTDAAIKAQGHLNTLIDKGKSLAEQTSDAYKKIADEAEASAKKGVVYTDAQIAAAKKAEFERINGKPTKAAGAVDLTGYNDAKNQMASLVSDYQNSQKQLDAAQKAGLISQASYSTQRSALIEAEKEQVSAAYEAEISALETAKDKSTTTAAQRIELDQKIADARANMVKAQKEADSQLEVLATNETGRLAKEKRSIDSYVQALGEQQKALELAGQRAVIGVGRGDKVNALDSQLNSQQDRYAQQALELENQRSDPSRNMSDEEFARKSQALADANKKATDQIRKNYADVENAQGDWTKGATSAWENYLDSAKDIAGQTKSLFTNAFSSMEDAVVNFATTGKLSFADFTKSIISDMARIAVRQAATGLLSSGISAFSSLFGSSTAGSKVSDYTGAAFQASIGHRATGGDVSRNSLYEVNELGPELYSQGGKSYLMTGANGGSVTPLTPGAASAGGSGMGGTTNITVNVAKDGSTSVDADTQFGLGAADALKKAMVSVYKEQEARSSSYGGAIWKASKGRL